MVLPVKRVNGKDSKVEFLLAPAIPPVAADFNKHTCAPACHTNPPVSTPFATLYDVCMVDTLVKTNAPQQGNLNKIK